MSDETPKEPILETHEVTQVEAERMATLLAHLGILSQLNDIRFVMVVRAGITLLEEKLGIEHVSIKKKMEEPPPSGNETMN